MSICVAIMKKQITILTFKLTVSAIRYHYSA